MTARARLRSLAVKSCGLAGVLATLSTAALAQAQQPTAEIRLDPVVQTALNETVAHAQLQGLPTEPLVDKAYEGTAKHAESARIIGAVRTLASGLLLARRELGSATQAADLVAAADALRAGVAHPLDPPRDAGPARREHPRSTAAAGGQL